MVAYLFWEVSLLALGAALALLALLHADGRQTDGAQTDGKAGGAFGAELLAGGLTAKLLLGAVIPHTLLFGGGGKPA